MEDKFQHLLRKMTKTSRRSRLEAQGKTTQGSASRSRDRSHPGTRSAENAPEMGC